MSKEPHLHINVFPALQTLSFYYWAHHFLPKTFSSSLFSMLIVMESSCFAVFSEQSILISFCWVIHPHPSSLPHPDPQPWMVSLLRQTSGWHVTAPWPIRHHLLLALGTQTELMQCNWTQKDDRSLSEEVLQSADFETRLPGLKCWLCLSFVTSEKLFNLPQFPTYLILVKITSVSIRTKLEQRLWYVKQKWLLTIVSVFSFLGLWENKPGAVGSPHATTGHVTSEQEQSQHEGEHSQVKERNGPWSQGWALQKNWS